MKASEYHICRRTALVNTILKRPGLEVGSMGKMNVSNDRMLSLFAEMVLDESIRSYKEQYLYKEIDLALAKGDEITFLALTTELKSLNIPGK
jgi:uncharacterized protein YpiB (UPF0302 family)